MKINIIELGRSKVNKEIECANHRTKAEVAELILDEAEKELRGYPEVFYDTDNSGTITSGGRPVGKFTLTV